MNKEDMPWEAYKAAMAAWLHWDASDALRRFLPKSSEVRDRYHVTLGVAEFLSWLLSLELSFKAFRTLFKGEDFCKIHRLDKLFNQMGKGAQEELLATLKSVLPEPPNREDVKSFLRRYSNAFVELRYFEGTFSRDSGTSSEQFRSDRELLKNLCGACLLMLQRRGIKPAELDLPIPSCGMGQGNTRGSDAVMDQLTLQQKVREAFVTGAERGWLLLQLRTLFRLEKEAKEEGDLMDNNYIDLMRLIAHNFPSRRIPLARVEEAEGRSSSRLAKVREWLETCPETIPPVVLWARQPYPCKLTILDGNHRITLARKRGDTHVVGVVLSQSLYGLAEV